MASSTRGLLSEVSACYVSTRSPVKEDVCKVRDAGDFYSRESRCVLVNEAFDDRIKLLLRRILVRHSNNIHHVSVRRVTTPQEKLTEAQRQALYKKPTAAQPPSANAPITKIHRPKHGEKTTRISIQNDAVSCVGFELPKPISQLGTSAKTGAWSIVWTEEVANQETVRITNCEKGLRRAVYVASSLVPCKSQPSSTHTLTPL